MLAIFSLNISRTFLYCVRNGIFKIRKVIWSVLRYARCPKTAFYRCFPGENSCSEIFSLIFIAETIVMKYHFSKILIKINSPSRVVREDLPQKGPSTVISQSFLEPLFFRTLLFSVAQWTSVMKIVNGF